MRILPVLLKDAYKIGHKFQYPADTTVVYSNLTPRGSRVKGVDGVIWFGLQYVLQEYLIDQFQKNFFERDRDEVVKEYQRRVDGILGPGTDVRHIAALHDLGYLPLKLKALPEGTLVPFRIPVLTIQNTRPEFFWLTNMLETLLSNVLWQASTSATTAFLYRREFERVAKETGADREFVVWQGHDFSMRGLSGIEAACMSGAAHLLSFRGTDSIPAIDFLEQFYGADCEKELIGGSVPATEHSVMCMGMQDGEFETLRRLITEVYPTGVVSIVSDTWDFWKVLTEYLPRLKNEIMARPGKLVIRPDSGDPELILCGDQHGRSQPEQAGAVRVLWDLFGGTKTSRDYRVLDGHVGLIYGDSITRERQTTILRRLQQNGFASTNVVLGIGSYTYQYVTRDTFGWAMKATYGETTRGPQNISKCPKTDDGVKKSASGLLRVDALWEVGKRRGLVLYENQTPEEEAGGLLQTVFENGKLTRFQTLAEIRERVEYEL